MLHSDLCILSSSLMIFLLYCQFSPHQTPQFFKLPSIVTLANDTILLRLIKVERLRIHFYCRLSLYNFLLTGMKIITTTPFNLLKASAQSRGKVRLRKNWSCEMNQWSFLDVYFQNNYQPATLWMKRNLKKSASHYKLTPKLQLNPKGRF